MTDTQLVRSRVGGAITTYSGIEIHPFDPRVEDIEIEDIARGLGHLCRFAGQIDDLYTVAQHSELVAERLQEKSHSAEIQLWGLLHDASEAYLLDFPSPLKRMPEFAFYRLAEERLLEVIAERFGLGWPCPGVVKDADRELLLAEQWQLRRLGEAPDSDSGYVKEIFVLTPEQARNAFLGRFASLSAAVRRKKRG